MRWDRAHVYPVAKPPQLGPSLAACMQTAAAAAAEQQQLNGIPWSLIFKTLAAASAAEL